MWGEPLVYSLMNAPVRPPIQLTIFSARAFFNSIACDETHAAGPIKSSLPHPTCGIQCAPCSAHGSSLLWIDGGYGHSLRVKEFLGVLHAGGIPRPLASTQPTPIHPLFHHVSPAALVREGKSILAAMGATNDLGVLADKATSLLCPTCGASIQRFAQPVRLLEEIVRVWSGSEISLVAESASPDLLRWAERHGFSTHAQTADLHHVRLHESPATLAALGPTTSLLRSLWAIADLRIVCSDGATTLGYTRHGWCSHCATSLLPVHTHQIRSLLERGLPADPTLNAAELIVLGDSMTLGHLLQTPVAQLPQLTSPRLLATVRILVEAGLGTLSLGMSTADLAATDIAALSVCASLTINCEGPHPILVDLPDHTLGAPRFQGCKQALERAALTTPIILTNRSVFEAPIPHEPTVHRTVGQSLGTLSISAPSERRYEIVLGATLRLHRQAGEVRAPFRLVAAALQASTLQTTCDVQFTQQSPYQLHAVSLFSAAGNSKTLLLDALGLQDPLANLYAASVDARSTGLRPRDFSLGATRSNPYICSTCTGLGVVLERFEELPRPLAKPCPVCHGLRCKSPVRDSMFRGTPFSRMLNQTCAEGHHTLKALPKAARTLALVERFGLQDIPLGMPLTLLSNSEQRAVLLVRAILHATRAKPSILLLEEPELALSDRQRAALDEVSTASPEAALLTRIEIAE